MKSIINRKNYQIIKIAYRLTLAREASLPRGEIPDA